jgi:hypothetical protein
MTTSIQFEVTGTEYEVIAITLTKEEVKAIYEQNKALKEEVKTLTKEVESQKSNSKYYQERNNELTKEINQANLLLTALGVQLQTNEEESYRRTELSITTRIALYIANTK